MEPESNQASITGSTLVIVDSPEPHSTQGTVTSSMVGRWGSTSETSRPTSSESSASEPTQRTWPSPHRQMGRGVPQNRSRDRAQSTLLDSHSPIPVSYTHLT